MTIATGIIQHATDNTVAFVQAVMHGKKQDVCHWFDVYTYPWFVFPDGSIIECCIDDSDTVNYARAFDTFGHYLNDRG